MKTQLSDGERRRFWTVGHSTRSATQLEELLQAHGIKAIIDVRAFPASRRSPHFSQKELSQSLARAGVAYHHLPALGGRRAPSPNSKNTAWNNPSFRAYADHMGTEEFESGIHQLVSIAGTTETAIMCAESLWWKCHRSLIADYLKAKGYEVIHILGIDKSEIHPYTPAARIVNGKLSYEGLLP